MASSPVEICNIALVSLGANTIAALTENSVSAIACNTNYANARDATLASAPWSFATRRVKLAAEETAPTFGFLRAFPLPSDHLHVWEVYESDQVTPLTIPWKVEEGKILTDAASPLHVRYIRKVTNVPLFTALFVDALAARIASDIAIPITRKLDIQQRHFEIFLEKVEIAKTLDSQQGSSDSLISNQLTDVR